MSSRPENRASLQDEPGGRGGGRAPHGERRGRRLVAVGFMQLVSLIGVVGLAVILGAVLVESAKITGWIDGLVIGAVSVLLTMLVLLSGRHARRR